MLVINIFKTKAYYYVSKSPMILMIFVFMNLEGKVPVMNYYKVNICYVKLNLTEVINVSNCTAH